MRKVSLLIAIALLLLFSIERGKGAENPANNCLEFDGLTSRAVVEHLDGFQTLNGADQFTFEAWIRPRSQGGGGRGRILEQPEGKLNWYLSDDTRFGFRAGQKAGWRLSEEGAIQYWEWQHIAVSSDGTQMLYFINGKQVKRIQKNIKLDITDGPLWIGDGFGEDHKPRGFDGWIDEVRLSNRCLYKAEFLPARHLTYDSTTVMLFHFDEDLTIPFTLDATPYNAEIQIIDPLKGTLNSPRRSKHE
jgi:hypothetical protein